MADPARELFEEFKNEGMVRIARCIQEKQKETLYIDFKQNIGADHRPTGELTEDGRRLLSENISAFANSGGGVLVWGIRDKGHYAEKEIPIPDVDAFVVQLFRATQQATAPPADGVDHISIPKEDGSGFAVTYVPDGKAKPYMAVQTTEQYTYFLRSGDSTKPMTDVMVRALVMYGARPSLKLRFEYESHKRTSVRPETPPGVTALGFITGMSVNFQVILENNGSTTTEAVAVAVEKMEKASYHLGSGGSDVNVVTDTGRYLGYLFRQQKLEPFYPGMIVSLGVIQFNTTNIERLGGNRYQPREDVVIRNSIYAKDFFDHATFVCPREQLVFE